MTSWTEETVFGEGSSYFGALERELEAATRSIDLETYIFEDDSLGRSLASTLSGAARRGVRVRVMVDGFGAAGWAARFADQLARAGVEARVYHPLPWSLLVAPLSRFPFLTRLLLMATNMNRRNHRKTCIVDGSSAWLGSMNITADHLVVARGGGGFRDTGARVSGPAVKELTWAFEHAWATALGVSPRGLRARWPDARRLAGVPPPPPSGLVRLNATRRQRRAANRELLARIAKAAARVWITSAYFVPNRPLTRALERAARQGVDVRILVPERSDVFFMHWLARLYYHGLLKSGARIFEFHPSVLHAKLVLLDELALVGSSNLNHRSIIHDLEADVILMQPRSRAALEEQFQTDQDRARELTLANERRPRLLERLAARLLYLMRYWL